MRVAVRGIDGDAAFSGIGPGYAGFSARYALGFAEAVAYGIAFQIGQYAGDHVGGTVGAVVALHALDPETVGLGDLGRPTGYVERQLARWRKQYEAGKVREVPLLEDLHERLGARVPKEQRPGVLAHGMLTMGLAVETIVEWLGDSGRILEYGVRFTRPVVVDAESGAELTVTAKVGAIDDEVTRIDLTVAHADTVVLGKAQVRVRTADQ